MTNSNRIALIKKEVARIERSTLSAKQYIQRYFANLVYHSFIAIVSSLKKKERLTLGIFEERKPSKVGSRKNSIESKIYQE